MISPGEIPVSANNVKGASMCSLFKHFEEGTAPVSAHLDTCVAI